VVGLPLAVFALLLFARSRPARLPASV
jgi:hypothetical protein